MQGASRSYSRAVTWLSTAAASAWASAVVGVLLAAWLVLGFARGFDRGWIDLLNAAAWFVALLMLFLLQHAQRKDTLAIQMKLDELLRAVERADERLVNVERLDHAELEELLRRRRPPAR